MSSLAGPMLRKGVIGFKGKEKVVTRNWKRSHSVKSLDFNHPVKIIEKKDGGGPDLKTRTSDHFISTAYGIMQ